MKTIQGVGWDAIVWQETDENMEFSNQVRYIYKKNGLYEWDGMKTLKNKFCEPDVHEIYRYIEWMG